MGSARKVGTNESIHTYGNGTRNYTALQTWEDAHTINCVTGTTSPVLECYDDAASFNDYVVILGATTDATYFRIIRPAAGQGHDGTPNNGVTFICTTDTNIFTLQEIYSQIQDIIAKVSIASGTAIRYAFTQSGSCNSSAVVGCIAYDCLIGSTGTGQGFVIAPTASNVGFAIDCLAHNCEGDGFRTSSFTTNSGGRFYNCTSTNNGTYGFRMLGNQATGVHIWTNCLASDNTTADFSDGTTGSPTRTVTYCASKDTTADDWGGAGNHISHTFTFVNSGGDDFHLASNDAGAIDLGTDLSADAIYPFNDDIDKCVRSGSWDIGFDEYVAYSINAALGSYDVSGISAGPLANRLISAGSGDYAITGVQANVLGARLLNGSPGDYVISGINATLARGYFISADGGVYLVTGSDATILAQRFISANVGSYLITGVSAQILAARLLNAELGTFTLTGVVVDLVHTTPSAYVLVVDPGSYLVFGTNAGLLSVRILDASPGIYNLMGKEVVTLAQRILKADPGTYVLTGIDAELLKILIEYFLNAEPGEYRLTGSVARAIIMLNEQILLEEIDMRGGLTQQEHDWLATQEAYVHNKKVLVKVGDTWHFRIYDETGVSIIVDKKLKDKDGNDITDIQVGVMTQELASTV